MFDLSYYQDKIKHKNHYDGHLIHNPQPIEGQAEPSVLFYKNYHVNQIEYSIIVPIHNQETIIENNIKSYIVNTSGTFEMILILDSCSDDSKNVVMKFFDSHLQFKNANFIQVIVIEQKTPIFETSCDNLGFSIAIGKYFVEIQADMEMIQFGYNEMLSKPCKMYNDVIGVSGRCAHSFRSISGAGKLGEKIQHRSDMQLIENKYFHIYGTCNRGPLLLDPIKLKEMGYLDEQNYFLGNDDHDLFYRALVEKSYVCGYVIIEFLAPIENGSTRKPMNLENQQIFQIRNQRTKPINKLFIIRKPEKRLLSYDLQI